MFFLPAILLLVPAPVVAGVLWQDNDPICQLVLDVGPPPRIVQGVIPIPSPELDPIRALDGSLRDTPLHWVTKDGYAVGREPFTWDANGHAVAYRVQLPVRKKFRGLRRLIYASEKQGKTEMKGLERVQQLDPVQLHLRSTPDRVYSANLVPRNAAHVRPGPWIDRAKTFQRLGDDSDPPRLAGAVHTYIESRADGVIVFTIRLSNGHAAANGAGAQGALYFTELWIDIPTGWELLAAEVDGGTRHTGRYELFPAGAGPYVLDERRQTIRRFALHRPGLAGRAERVLALADNARAAGPASYLQGGYGSRAVRLPDFDREPLRSAWAVDGRNGQPGLDGFPALEQLGLDALQHAIGRIREGRGERPGGLREFGLCHPDGERERGQPGGWLIQSTPGNGFLTRSWTARRRLGADRMAERMPVAFDIETGEPLTAHAIATAMGGIFPFEIHLTGGTWEDKHELPFWRDLEPIGEPHKSKDLNALRSFAPIDAEHYTRAFIEAYTFALATGDDLACDLVREAAARCEMEWNIEPSPPKEENGKPKGFWRDPSLTTRLEEVRDKPGRGLWSTRDFAWTIECIVAAYRLTPPGERREELARWMEHAARFIDTVQLQSGLCMARFPRFDPGAGRHWSGLAPDPFQNGALEPDWAAAQWLEESLRGNASASLAVNLRDDELSLKMLVNVHLLADTLMNSMRELERSTPPKWIGSRPGTNELYFADYGSENFQSQSLLRLGGAPPELIYAIHGDGTLDDYVAQIVRATRGWAPDLFSHAAVTIAEAINR